MHNRYGHRNHNHHHHHHTKGGFLAAAIASTQPRYPHTYYSPNFVATNQYIGYPQPTLITTMYPQPTVIPIATYYY